MKFEEIERRFSPAKSPVDFSSLPPVIYHYTDANGLLGMLASGRIWATEYRFLNDRSEVEHTRALVNSVILNRMKNAKHAKMSGLYSRILNDIGDPQDDTEIYVFSLSEEEDSLSQWRGYAHDGRGFTIGFDTAQIVAIAEKENAQFGFCRVEYDVSRQERGLVAALDAIETECGKRLGSKSANSDNIFGDASSSFDVISWNRAVANKHSSFSSEREWRIFSFCEGENRNISHVRARPAGLIPYFELNSQELCARDILPISRIGIGPGFPDQGQYRAVQVLCRKYGYDPEIYFASAPYRAG